MFAMSLILKILILRGKHMKRFIAFVLLVAITISLCACMPSKTETPMGTQPTVQTDPQVTEPVESEPTKPVEPTTPIETPATTINPHATKMELNTYLIDKAYQDIGSNVMFSPLSLDIALGMAAQGAGSEYESLFTDLFGRENYAQFVKEYMEHADDLNSKPSQNALYKNLFEIANALVIAQDYDLTEQYTKKVNNFNPRVEKFDFKDISAVVSKINNWCKEKTHDMIDEIVKEQNFNDDTVAVLLNSIYFESPWREAWTNMKEKQDFTLFNNDVKTVDTIKTVTPFYYENESATAFGAQYMNGMEFIGILPKETGDFLIKDLDLESLLASRTTIYDVHAQMPKFKFDNKIENIVESLTEAGYGILFDAEVGMFSQMLYNENGQANLHISNIIQATAIELDENGTKAAAVTAIMMDNACAAPDVKLIKEVTLDRPFAFIIYDSTMDQIVFIGKVVNP